MVSWLVLSIAGVLPSPTVPILIGVPDAACFVPSSDAAPLAVVGVPDVLVDLLELPHAAASSAAPTTTAAAPRRYHRTSVACMHPPWSNRAGRRRPPGVPTQRAQH